MLVIAALFCGAAGLSLVSGTQPHLPGTALGWNALFHVERASAMLAAVGIVLLVGWRAIDGNFPTKFGNVEYAVDTAAGEFEEQVLALEERMDKIEIAHALERPEKDDGRDEEIQ